MSVNVKVLLPIWLGGQVVDTKIHNNASDILIDFANGEVDKKSPRAFFVDEDGVRTSYTKEVEESNDDPEAGDGKEAIDENSEFITSEEFVAMDSTTQGEYVESIKDNENEEELYKALNAYNEVATTKKVKAVIEKALSEYEQA